MDAIYRAPGQSTTISTYAVEIVCQSPTGDQSTSWTFHLPCSTAGQAEAVAAMWRKVWDIPAYGNSATLDIDGVPSNRPASTYTPII